MVCRGLSKSENVIPTGCNTKSYLHTEVAGELAGHWVRLIGRFAGSQRALFKQTAVPSSCFKFVKPFLPVPPSEAQFSRRKSILPFS